MSPDHPLQDTLELLARLHRHKDAAYGDAWRKRGEVIAIFANLACKYDRLGVGISEGRPASTDPLADTIGDLCVYAGKYLTWLAETHPDAFAARPPELAAAAASAQRGPPALEVIFDALPRWERTTDRHPPDTVATAWIQVQEAFTPLEAGLIAQSDANAPHERMLAWTRKVDLAWALTEASAWLLQRLADEDPTRLDGLRREVAAMDQWAVR